MTDDYTPPQIWHWEQDENAAFPLNRPVAGATSDRDLPVGDHPLQLYSLATPNGVKVTIMLEELLSLGHSGAEYDAHLIRIMDGDQFTSGFVDVNPNSKIPALVDRSTNPETKVFESGSIVLYLAEKFRALVPTELSQRTSCMNWVFWQMGSAPMVGGGFGHFYHYAPVKLRYCIDRFTMETKRQLDVLDRHLAQNEFMVGENYSIADIMIYPWYGALVLNRLYEAAEFLDATSYRHVTRWADTVSRRGAVIRGQKVNRTWGPLTDQLHERHAASDFDTKTQDKLA
ncbi:MAG: glutathione-dependent disulfide-bond oxidoreductase [bacterium]|nr:glutathione-dependent disulfide-bond oxidoreductase [bacterium]